jgi:hypothetical protein
VAGELDGEPSDDPSEEPEAVRDARRFGFDEAAIAAVRAALGQARGQDESGVWAEHVPAVAAFLVVGTQWRTAPRANGGLIFLGLDYAGVRAGLEGAGLTATPEIWAGLRVLEGAAAAALNEG